MPHCNYEHKEGWKPQCRQIGEKSCSRVQYGGNRGAFLSKDRYGSSYVGRESFNEHKDLILGLFLLFLLPFSNTM
ncbi:hypothetical protein LINPERHAP2_LOCUS14281 [Linum perenne]